MAYELARQWVLNNEEYTHLVILPDDLICTQEQIEKLLTYGLSVVSGWCNVDKVHDWANISMSLPPSPPSSGRLEQYNFLTIPEVEYVRNRSNDILLPVSYGGFAPAVINRNILSLVPFRGSGGCCVDSCFSIDLAYMMLQQFIDLSVRTYHLRQDDSNDWYSSIQTGKKEPYVDFQPWLNR